MTLKNELERKFVQSKNMDGSKQYQMEQVRKKERSKRMMKERREDGYLWLLITPSLTLLLPPPIPSFPPPSPLLIHTTPKTTLPKQPTTNPKPTQNNKVYNPANCETVELLFECKKIARVVGGLARIKPQSGTPVR